MDSAVFAMALGHVGVRIECGWGVDSIAVELNCILQSNYDYRPSILLQILFPNAHCATRESILNYTLYSQHHGFAYFIALRQVQLFGRYGCGTPSFRSQLYGVHSPFIAFVYLQLSSNHSFDTTAIATRFTDFARSLGNDELKQNNTFYSNN